MNFSSHPEKRSISGKNERGERKGVFAHPGKRSFLGRGQLPLPGKRSLLGRWQIPPPGKRSISGRLRLSQPGKRSLLGRSRLVRPGKRSQPGKCGLLGPLCRVSATLGELAASADELGDDVGPVAGTLVRLDADERLHPPGLSRRGRGGVLSRRRPGVEFSGGTRLTAPYWDDGTTGRARPVVGSPWPSGRPVVPPSHRPTGVALTSRSPAPGSRGQPLMALP